MLKNLPQGLHPPHTSPFTIYATHLVVSTKNCGFYMFMLFACFAWFCLFHGFSWFILWRPRKGANVLFVLLYRLCLFCFYFIIFVSLFDWSLYLCFVLFYLFVLICYIYIYIFVIYIYIYMFCFIIVLFCIYLLCFVFIYICFILIFFVY